MTSAQVSKLGQIAIAAGVINFLAFIMGALALGGDAVNGKTENGRYYVANHGKLTEVSAAAFNYSRVHCYSVWTTHPLSMFCAYQLYRQKRRAERCED